MGSAKVCCAGSMESQSKLKSFGGDRMPENKSVCGDCGAEIVKILYPNVSVIKCENGRAMKCDGEESPEEMCRRCE